MTVAIVVFIALGIGGFWYFRRTRKDQVTETHAKISKPNQAYSGVEIHCGQNSCSESKQLRGTRLLASNAPALPLVGCTADACTCSYRKWDDRRQENRRRSDDGIEPVLFDGKDHRASFGRRKKDQLAGEF